MTKIYHQSFATFTGNKIRGTHLVFCKRRFQGFEILRMVGLLGEKFTFSTLLGQPKFQRVSDLLYRDVLINVVLLINFPEQFELRFYFKYIQVVIKFYNLGDKTFETDFNMNNNF